MIKTQVQIPDHLYREAKRIAEEYEMSFAEVVRRGLEKIVLSYPRRVDAAKPWKLPTVDVGRLKVPLDELKDYSAGDETLRSLPKRRR